MNWIAKYVLGLMPGLEDMSLLGAAYDTLERTKLFCFTTDRDGVVVFSAKHNKFWLRRTSSTADLLKMPFGLDPEGNVVRGSEAVETTLEAGLVPCTKAPYGARKFLKSLQKLLE